MEDKFAKLKQFAMDNYETWGNWEVECNSMGDWQYLLDKYGDSPEGLRKWAEFSMRVLEIKKENRRAYGRWSWQKGDKMTQVKIEVTTNTDDLLRHFGRFVLVYQVVGRELPARLREVDGKKEAFLDIDNQSLWLSENLFTVLEEGE